MAAASILGLLKVTAWWLLAQHTSRPYDSPAEGLLLVYCRGCSRQRFSTA